MPLSFYNLKSLSGNSSTKFFQWIWLRNIVGSILLQDVFTASTRMRNPFNICLSRMGSSSLWNYFSCIFNIPCILTHSVYARLAIWFRLCKSNFHFAIFGRIGPFATTSRALGVLMSKMANHNFILQPVWLWLTPFSTSTASSNPRARLAITGVIILRCLVLLPATHCRNAFAWVGTP